MPSDVSPRPEKSAGRALAPVRSAAAIPAAITLAFALLLTACSGVRTDDGATLMDRALAGAHRADANRARDVFRHPRETLLFFGLRPDMTVVEIWPGGG